MTDSPEYKEPDWYDRNSLRKARYAADEVGWIVDLGDGTCRVANDPLCGGGGDWGDIVGLVPVPDDFPQVNWNDVRERYDPEKDRV